MTIKAIETHYNGYRFRSRLEARWAVFFDYAGQEYRYESDGYDVAGIRYLPDFQLLSKPGVNGYGNVIQSVEFVEIKPTLPTRQEWNKAVLLATETHKEVSIFAGDIDIDVEIYQIMGDMGDIPDFLTDVPEYARDKTIAMRPYTWGYATWKECMLCRRIELISEWMTDENGVDLCCHCGESGEHLLNSASQKLLTAYTAARSARFEYGETPKVPRDRPRK